MRNLPRELNCNVRRAQPSIRSSFSRFQRRTVQPLYSAVCKDTPTLHAPFEIINHRECSRFYLEIQSWSF